jgi:hypothetical protein
MKKITSFLLGVVLSFLFAAVAFATEYETKKTFGVTGEFIVYIPFDFEVPSGNCGGLETWENIPSYPSIYGASLAHWELKISGEFVRHGLYKFKNTESICDPKVSIFGTINEMNSSDTLEGREIEPEDMGILVKGGTKAGNVFGLPTDDRKYSYELVHNSFGMSMSLDVLIKNWYLGGNREIVGAVLPGERGFLTRVVWKKQFGKNSGIIKEDEYIVLIIKENY